MPGPHLPNTPIPPGIPPQDQAELHYANDRLDSFLRLDLDSEWQHVKGIKDHDAFTADRLAVAKEELTVLVKTTTSGTRKLFFVMQGDSKCQVRWEGGLGASLGAVHAT